MEATQLDFTREAWPTMGTVNLVIGGSRGVVCGISIH